SAEVCAGQVGACHAIVEEGLADRDPWHGFCLVIEKICALHARNRDFTAAFAAAFPRDAGRLRADFVLDDLVLMLMANNGIRAASPATRVAASRRFARLVIQAFQ